jgi:ribosomal protein S18 acetylase RimI-like enzyme
VGWADDAAIRSRAAPSAYARLREPIGERDRTGQAGWLGAEPSEDATAYGVLGFSATAPRGSRKASPMVSFRLRPATADDADQVALLHADSWRRHYRGAYADEFLDSDELEANRRTIWSARLTAPAGTATVLAADEAGLVGFVHVVLDDDSRWGSLVDNLHVRNGLRRTGIGTVLLTAAARAAVAESPATAMYLWVLEQNTPAQAFYRARGGTQVERVPCRPPGIPVSGAPHKLRMFWPDLTALTQSLSGRGAGAGSG